METREVQGSVSAPQIAVCDFEPTVGNVNDNLNEMANIIKSCSTRVEVAVFPELALTGYDLDILPEHAVEVSGPETKELVDIAAESGVDLVVGIPEHNGNDLYNSLLYVSGDGVRGVYRKRRPWGDETDIFATGTEATTVETPVGKAGFLLCYDLNFPELAMEYVAEECDLVFVSAAWRQSFAADWKLLARARALDSTCYVAASNHHGSQSGRVHAGESLITGPRGDILAKTTADKRVAICPVEEAVLEYGRERNPVREAKTEEF